MIVSDEHKPYNTLAKNYVNIKAHGGCWAHCRRKFSDAAKGRRNASEAHKILLMIAALYKQDDALKHLSGQAKIDARYKKVKPHLLQIKRTLDQYSTEFVTQGLMNKAIHYARNNWPKFIAFLDHPELPLDNNPIERAIRPFTLGRKNWIFSGSPRGAAASAFLFEPVLEPIGKYENVDFILPEKYDLDNDICEISKMHPSIDIQKFEQLGKRGGNDYNCDIGMTKLLFTQNGSVHRCYKLLNDQTLSGPSLSSASVAEVWHGSSYTQQVKPPLSVYNESQCSTCVKFSECNDDGRCIFQSYANNKTYYAPDRICGGPF